MSRFQGSDCRLAGAALSLLAVAVVVTGTPAGAAPTSGVNVITDLPTWDRCTTSTQEQCLESATITPAGASEPVPVDELGIPVQVRYLAGPPQAINFELQFYRAAAQPPEVLAGEVRLVIRSGAFTARWTLGRAQRLRAVEQTGDDGLPRLSVVGRISNYMTNLNIPCDAAGCGDENTMADQDTSGYAFNGATLERSLNPDHPDAFNGFAITSNAQTFGTMITVGHDPDLYWEAPLLANPHLDWQGNPARGNLFAWMPDRYFTELGGTTPEEAAATGLNVLVAAPDGSSPVSYPATVTREDGGLSIAVTDLPFSAHQIKVVSQASTAVQSGPPSGPRQVRTIRAGSLLRASWTPPASTGGVGLAVNGYLARAFTAQVGGTVAASCTAPPSATSCDLAGLNLDHTEYAVAVSATNQFGEGAPLGRVMVSGSAGPPSAPSSVTATVHGRQVRITWTPPADPGGSTVTGYSVALTTSGRTRAVATCAARGSARSCTVTAPGPGSYTAQVVAVNAAGRSAARVTRAAARVR